jgi:hypothetical protein
VHCRLRQSQARRRHHRGWTAATPELQQPLATLANEALPLPQPELLVAVVAVKKGLQLLLLASVKRNRWGRELTLEKTSKPIMPTLQVRKAAIGL